MSETVVFQANMNSLTPLELVWISESSEYGKRFRLTGGQYTFGRGDSNAITLTDATISTRHGVLLYAEEGSIVVCDQGSTNGITVDGKKMRMVTLSVGQEIQIGSVSMKLVKAGQSIESASLLIPVALDSQSLSTSRWVWPVAGVTGIIILGLFIGIISLSHFGQTVPSPTSAELMTPKRESVVTNRTIISAPSKLTRPKMIQHSAKPTQKRINTISKAPNDSLIKATQITEQAELAFNERRFTEAYRLWKQVMMLDASNTSAQEGLKKIEGVAGKIYEEALMVKSSSPDQFQVKIKTVFAISEPGSSLHTRSQALLGGAA